MEAVHTMNFFYDIWNQTHLPVPYCLPFLQSGVKFFVKKGIITEYFAIMCLIGLQLTAVKNPHDL